MIDPFLDSLSAYAESSCSPSATDIDERSIRSESAFNAVRTIDGEQNESRFLEPDLESTPPNSRGHTPVPSQNMHNVDVTVQGRIELPSTQDDTGVKNRPMHRSPDTTRAKMSSPKIDLTMIDETTSDSFSSLQKPVALPSSREDRAVANKNKNQPTRTESLRSRDSTPSIMGPTHQPFALALSKSDLSSFKGYEARTYETSFNPLSTPIVGTEPVSSRGSASTLVKSKFHSFSTPGTRTAQAGTILPPTKANTMVHRTQSAPLSSQPSSIGSHLVRRPSKTSNSQSRFSVGALVPKSTSKNTLNSQLPTILDTHVSEIAKIPAAQNLSSFQARRSSYDRLSLKNIQNEHEFNSSRKARELLSASERSSLDRALKKINSTTNSNEVVNLLAQGADPNSGLDMYERSNNIFSAPPLYHSAASGNAACLEVLLRFGAVPTCGKSTNTPLKAAVDSKNAQCTALLLHAGALSINTSTTDRAQLLYAAISEGDVQIAQLLLDYGCTPDNSHLEVAQSISHVGIIELLLKKGLTPGSRNLTEAVSMAEPDITTLLLNYGATPTLSHVEKAVSLGQTTIVHVLLCYWKQPIAAADEQLNLDSILDKAIILGNREIVALLLRTDFRLGLKAESASLLKAIAALAPTEETGNANKHVDIINLLMIHGLVPDARCLEKALDCLEKADSMQSAEVVFEGIRMLLEHAPDRMTSLWYPALHAAVHLGTATAAKMANSLDLTNPDVDLHVLHKARLEIMESLLHRGVNPNTRQFCQLAFCAWGNPTAHPCPLYKYSVLECLLSCAHANDQEEEEEVVSTIELLLEYGAQPTLCAVSGAVKRNQENIVQLLLKANTVDDQRSGVHESFPACLWPTELAIADGNKAMTQLLLYTGGVMGSIGMDSLEMVARGNDVEIAEIIMRRTTFHFTPRHARSIRIAIASRNVNLVKLFLSFGCPIDTHSFEWALETIGEPLIDLMLKPKEHTNSYQDFNEEQLTYEIESDEESRSKTFPTLRDVDTLMYALSYAAKMNWLTSMERLIDQEVDIRSNLDGFLPPLGNAISGHAVDCVEALLLKGADINEKRDANLVLCHQRKQKIHWTPLHAAVQSYIEVDGANSEDNLAAGANQGSKKERALRIVRLLIHAGASKVVLAYDPAAGRPLSISDRLQTSKDTQRRLKGYATPLDLAQKMPNSDARRRLLQVLGSP
jgi:ankyrin repeat protein